MTRLPRISGRNCIRALERAGFYMRHQKGSHAVMRRDLPFAQTVVPMHRELSLGTLRSIISQAGLSVEQFTEFLNQ